MVAVEVASPTARFMIVACHAPCRSNARPDSEISQWWQEMTHRIVTWRRAPRPVFVLIDANVRMGDTIDQHVGPRGAEPEDPHT
eukprot:6147384-Alexandrium_andersonii.AAC.1